jgi:hypothetical protein
MGHLQLCWHFQIHSKPYLLVLDLGVFFTTVSELQPPTGSSFRRIRENDRSTMSLTRSLRTSCHIAIQLITDKILTDGR